MKIVQIKKPKSSKKYNCDNTICNSKIEKSEIYTRLKVKLVGATRQSTHKICGSCWSGDRELILE